MQRRQVIREFDRHRRARGLLGFCVAEPLDTAYLPRDEPSTGRSMGERSGPSLGATLDRFTLERRLGKGGMGEVFAARDAASGRIVALKTLTNTHPTLRYRFKREFRALADVEHPNLVRLGELFVPEQGPSFFTMELLEGEPFTRALRGTTPVGVLPPLPALEQALRQLLAGLACLHANHCVHRDLKPSNVLVTPAGRVVILDFGIVSELGDERETTDEGGIVGTPIYMAPEQAAGAPAEPATDLYALGVMLFECLCGRLPFEGPALQVLVDKQFEPAPDPATLVGDLPPRLREMCTRLLQRDPARRPTIAELLARLDGGGARASAGAVGFVGRMRELAALDEALAAMHERKGVVQVQVRGPSGVGKSALVQHFLAGSNALVLRGRCRERESVPYKGVDAVVDALSLHLRRASAAELARLRPRYPEALAKVFPVLDELWVRADEYTLAPHEARNLGWAALRELLERIAAREPTIVAIDDFQWSDHDTVAILRALTREPDAPALLVVIGARDQLPDCPADDPRQTYLNRADVRRIDVGPLPESDAHALALALLRAQRDPARVGELAPLRSRADAVVLRCAGNPFFIGQMVLAGESSEGSPDLEQLVAARLAALDREALALLEVIAVAGRPLPQVLVLELAGLAQAEAWLDALLEQGLIVRSESGAHLVETAHDRIRERCLAALSPARKAAIHWAIGERLLERAGVVPSGEAVFEIVDHLDAGLPSLGEPSDERRLELVRLHRIAGERAASAAAWASARRYFELGHQLAQPWRELAARSPLALRSISASSSIADPRTLAVRTAFGRAQAESMAASAQADKAFEELLAWPLSSVERGHFVARRVALLAYFNRLDEAVALGLEQLARLGLELPRTPSLARALLEVLRGWWALGRRPVEQLRALPDMRDLVIRARLDVLVEVSFVAPYVSPPLLLTLAGYALRTIHAHGYHVAAPRLLTQLALAIGVLGRPRAAAALCDRALTLAEQRSVRPLDLVNARVLAQFMVWPASRPLPGLLADLEAVQREACELGLAFEAGYLTVAASFYLFEIDMALPGIAALLDRFEARNPGFGGAVNQPGIASVRRHIEQLVSGREAMSPVELRDAIPMLRYLGQTLEVVAGVLMADYAHACARMDAMPPDYAEVLVGVLAIPRFAMFAALLEAWRCPARPGLARARCLRRLRGHLRVVARWAAQGPENFGPMHALAQAEHARARGRLDAAAGYYEQALAGARQGGAAYLQGLATLRKATLARDRGQLGHAQRCFGEALDIYEDWGALALVTVLRERGLERA
jgi:tetratricopeptide (TPR) repeat protein